MLSIYVFFNQRLAQLDECISFSLVSFLRSPDQFSIHTNGKLFITNLFVDSGVLQSALPLCILPVQK